MNSFSTFGIFAVLLFAYCTPTRGQAIAVSDVVFENGEKNEFTNLIKSSDDTFKIGKSGREFGVKGVDMMLGKDVVLRTDENSYVQMKLAKTQDSQQLFDLTTRSKLGEHLYSGKVAAVYQFQEGLILENVTISGFENSVTEKRKHRHVIHSGEALSSKFEPHLIWTEEYFNYYAWNNGVILILRPKPADKTYYRYYLVTFHTLDDVSKWVQSQGQYYTNQLPSETDEVFNYFKPLIQYNRDA